MPWRTEPDPRFDVELSATTSSANAEVREAGSQLREGWSAIHSQICLLSHLLSRGSSVNQSSSCDHLGKTSSPHDG